MLPAPEPPRLLSKGGDGFERELLRSWDLEQPSEAARAHALAAVGIAAGAAGAAKAAAGASLAPKGTWLGGALVKWALLGVLGFGTAGAAYVYVHGRQVAPPKAESPRPPPSIEATVPSAPATAEASVAAPVTPTASPPVVATPARPSKHAAPSASALAEQVATLDRARAALASGEAPAALREIAACEARYPRGALFEEAEVLRIEALLAEGDRAAAARAGARFLTAHPSSPHAPHVRALLAPAADP
ncbi:MAG TPA: outer membrane protein assembly factor BamD [Polyangiaceae bacterium]